MPSIQFGRETVVAWQFKTQPKTTEEYNTSYDKGRPLFEQAIEAEMDRRQNGNPNHPVSAFPLGGGNAALVVDGPELKRLPWDILQEQQRFMQAELQHFEKSGRAMPLNYEKLVKSSPAPRFNWVTGTNRWDLSSLQQQAKMNVMYAHQEKAERSGNVINVEA